MDLKKDLRSGLSCNKNGYFNSFQNNVFGGEMPEKFQEMFDNGSGGELHSKAEAVHSSSMLAYNFFHWIDEKNPFVWDSVKYTNVYFEVKMRTLTCRSNPANMDVVLKGKDMEGKDCLLFIESKFLEYTESKSFDLSDSYEKKDNWYVDNIQWKEIIHDEVRPLVADKEWKNVNKYGVKQLITHLFGITSLKNEDALKWFNENNVFKIEKDDLPRIKFISLVFEPADKYEEYKQYEKYVKLEERFFDKLNDYLPVHKTYSELWKVMESQIKDSQLKEFLEQRYMRFAKKV